MINYLFALVCFVTTNFYSLQFQDIDGNTISMNSFQGKKVLLVNIATGNDKVYQLAGLQQLQQQYQDSLVVIAFPSNSFGKESRTNAEIKTFCDTAYHTTFILASKGPVSGSGAQTVFNWLAHKTANGDIDAAANGDFQKFLVDKTGHVVAMLSSKIKPMDAEMIDAITTNY
jgi:glutathione peroxidase